MICKNCGHVVSDDAKFCEECGAKIEKEEIKNNDDVKAEGVQPAEDKQEGIDNVGVKEEQETAEETNEQVADCDEIVEEKEQENESVKEWYYVENNDSKGAFTLEEMISFIEQKILNGESLVWKVSMKDWAKLKETELEDYLPSQEETQDADHVWYYVENNDSVGPFTKEEMQEKVNAGILSGNSFVWKVGMDDWQRLKDTELAAQEKQAPVVKPSISQCQDMTFDPMVKKKSIGLALVLSIVTCGIYGIYWLYSMAKDLNELARSQNQPTGPDPFLVVILGIVTCHIYNLYFFWKAGKTLSNLTKPNGQNANDDSVILLVLSLLGLDIVSYCILQSSINDFAKD